MGVGVGWGRGWGWGGVRVGWWWGGRCISSPSPSLQRDLDLTVTFRLDGALDQADLTQEYHMR